MKKTTWTIIPFLIFMLILIYSCSKKSEPRPIPTASFMWANLTDGLIQFTDDSKEADSYDWDFGDGTTKSIEKNPKHDYEKNGSYTVTLTVKNPSGDNKITKNVDVSTIPAPSVDFSVTLGDDGLVTFLNLSKNAASYEWDFGDGSKSIEMSPKKTYTENKKYTILLIATGRGGTSKENKDITVNSIKPVAEFNFEDKDYFVPSEVAFKNKSVNATSYNWDFGDGSANSTEDSPSHNFTKDGVYKVTLTAKTGVKESKIQKNITIKPIPTIEGTIITTQDGSSVASATISDDNGKIIATCDRNGAFKFPSTNSGKFIKVSIKANGYITRKTNIIDKAHFVKIDIIEDKPPFSLDYYGQLVYWTNGNFSLTDRTAPYPSIPWDVNPKIYIKTTLSILNASNNGNFIKSSTEEVPISRIDAIKQALPIIFQEITNGKIKIEKIETGKDRLHVAEIGWIRIELFDRTNNPQNFSGRGSNYDTMNGSTKGITGKLEFGINSPYQYCKQGPDAGLLFHEMGHCLGLGHTTNIDKPNMMAGGLGCTVEETHYSSLEKYHGRIMYSRPRGNVFPDIDPNDFAF